MCAQSIHRREVLVVTTLAKQGRNNNSQTVVQRNSESVQLNISWLCLNSISSCLFILSWSTSSEYQQWSWCFKLLQKKRSSRSHIMMVLFHIKSLEFSFNKQFSALSPSFRGATDAEGANSGFKRLPGYITTTH